MDYANRKPKKQPKRGAKKKPSSTGARGASRRQPESRQVPWLIIAVAIALIAAFTYGLVKINGSSESSEQAPVIQPPPRDLLPERTEERWQYIEELESKEVQVDVPERELGPPKLMQCGSFRQKPDAERLRAQIAMTGLESQIRGTTGSNGLWYRVILGPYETKRDAERDRHKLQRAQVFGCAIWNWNLD